MSQGVNIYGELIRAQFENLSADPASGNAGRIWWNTVLGQGKLDNGTAIRAFLLNDQNIVIGNSGTAASNVRINRSAAAQLQLVLATDVVAEGTLESDQTKWGALVAKLGGSQVDTYLGYTEQGSTPSTPASGTSLFYAKADGFYRLASTGAETKIGAGSGSINYVTNGDAETDTTGWATYADAAGIAPVDGTGGSPTETWTRSTSSPLRGVGSFILTKDAANRQGQGASYNFTIASADQANPCSITFEYSPSANFVAGTSSGSLSDVVVYIYDVTNSVLIQPAPYILAGGSGSNHRFSATFQPASNSTSYRLIFHTAGTNASAWTLKIDDVAVAPQILLYGSPVSDPVIYTMTIGGSTSAPTKSSSPTVDVANWFRIGRYMQITYNFVASGTSGSAAGSGTYLFPLPSGYSIDTAYQNVGTGQNNSAVGPAMVGTSTTNNWGVVKAYSATQLVIEVGNDTTGKSQVSSTYLPINSTSAQYSFTALVPILGWGSNVVMSQDASTRVVGLRASLTTSTTGIASGVIIFNNVISDTHSAFNSATGVYTVPVSGYYRIAASTLVSNIASSTNGTLQILVNGSAVKETYNPVLPATSTSQSGNISDTYFLNAGSTISIQCNGDASFDLDNNGTRTTLAIDRVAGPATIAASETVACSYGQSSAQVINTGANAIVDFSTKSYDTHGAVTTGASWKFTAPISGTYSVRTSLVTSSYTSTSGAITVNLYKNGSGSGRVLDFYSRQSADVSSRARVGGGADIQLNAGDTLSISVDNQSGANCTFINDDQYNWITIHRIGSR